MEKTISIYWFAILFLVAAAISLMVLSFYNHPYDVREAEASILKDRIADCIAPTGRLNTKLVNDSIFNPDFAENFLENCNIIFDVEEEHEWERAEQYYLEVVFYDESNKKVFDLSQGNFNLRGQCLDNPERKFNILPGCTWSSFYSFDNGKNKYFIDILTTVRKTEENAKL